MLVQRGRERDIVRFALTTVISITGARAVTASAAFIF
jgi:hypothetical protein